MSETRVSLNDCGPKMSQEERIEGRGGERKGEEEKVRGNDE